MGARFKLFPQPPFGGGDPRPEIVTVSSSRLGIGPGPSDERMYVIEPIGKREPYGLSKGPLGTPYASFPPWRGYAAEPALPDANGNFDYLTPDAPGFAAAHTFGAVRFAMDVWERYLGRPLQWHFRNDYERLEISLLPEWDNAQFGYGFLEVGSQFERDGRILNFSLDLDVIAHELGHAIVYSIIGVPRPGTEFPEYVGLQESFGDCVSLITVMHFPSVLEDTLEETGGNLYLFNRLARFSEFSSTRQMRMVSNSLTMADFAQGWTDEHDLAQPLTGAVFDILVDVFHEKLVDRRAITRGLEDFADIAEEDPSVRDELQSYLDEAYRSRPNDFLAALMEARDVIGFYLAETITNLDADFIRYGDFARTMLAIDGRETGGRYGAILRRNFLKRGIGRIVAGPRLSKIDRKSHMHAGRHVSPHHATGFPRMTYREQYMKAALSGISS